MVKTIRTIVVEVSVTKRKNIKVGLDQNLGQKVTNVMTLVEQITSLKIAGIKNEPKEAANIAFSTNNNPGEVCVVIEPAENLPVINFANGTCLNNELVLDFWL